MGENTDHVLHILQVGTGQCSTIINLSFLLADLILVETTIVIKVVEKFAVSEE